MRMATDRAVFREHLLATIRNIDGDDDLFAADVAEVGDFVHTRAARCCNRSSSFIVAGMFATANCGEGRPWDSRIR